MNVLAAAWGQAAWGQWPAALLGLPHAGVLAGAFAAGVLNGIIWTRERDLYRRARRGRRPGYVTTTFVPPVTPLLPLPQRDVVVFDWDDPAAIRRSRSAMPPAERSHRPLTSRHPDPGRMFVVPVASPAGPVQTRETTVPDGDRAA